MDVIFTPEELNAIDDMVAEWVPSARDERNNPQWVEEMLCLQDQILAKSRRSRGEESNA